MNRSVNNTAKRMALIVLTASGLAGCAVYDPAYGPYPTVPYGQSAYSAPSYYSYPQPIYHGPPVTIQPPVFFDFSYRSRSAHRGHHHGWHDGHRQWRGEPGVRGGPRSWGDGRGRYGDRRR